MNCNRNIFLKTDQGSIRICCLARPDDICGCTFDRQFTLNPQLGALSDAHRLVEKFAGQPDVVVVVALTGNSHVIGYGVLAYPEPDERWAELGPQVMMEVRAIEVARNWRSYRIASAILNQIVCTPEIEENILYMVGYAWTWDLIGTATTAQQYRQMLIRLFEPHGFKVYQTNEPNVCLKPENLFMCRVGRQVSRLMLDRFKWLRFGLSPWTW